MALHIPSKFTHTRLMLLKFFPFLSHQLGPLGLWKFILASGTLCSVSIFPTAYFCLLRVCVCPPACFWQPQKSTALSLGPAVPACHIRADQHALTGVSEWLAPSKVGPQLKAKNKSSPRQSVGLSDSTYARRSQHSPPDTNGLWQRLHTRRHYLPPACTLTP